MFLRSSSRHKHKTDRELSDLYRRSGEAAVLGELYQRHMHMVYGVCLKYLRSREESKDAVMQIFEHLTKTFGRHEVDNFPAWLHTITKNHCLMVLRSVGRETAEEHLEKFSDGNMENAENPYHQDERYSEEELLCLEQSIEGLPDDQRVCVRMFYLEQKSYKEVSEATGLDLNKVKSHIQNGKRNLKISLEKHKREF